MGQVEDLKLFVTVVDQGSIARAADEMRIAKSAVSRRLAQLESRYDVRLIDRTPGVWAITQAGKELYQRAVPIIGDAEDLTADFMPDARKPSGPLRVTIAHEFGMSFLKPILFQFKKDHPEIEVSFDFDDRMVDMDAENYDLAIRISDVAHHKGQFVNLGKIRHGLFASPTYLEHNGVPSDVAGLAGHAILQYGAHRRSTWHFDFGGKPMAFDFKPALHSNSGTFLVGAAIQSLGIVRSPEFLVTGALETGALVRVLPDLTFPDFDICLVHSPTRRINKRMRVFIEAVTHHCAIFHA